MKIYRLLDTHRWLRAAPLPTRTRQQLVNSPQASLIHAMSEPQGSKAPMRYLTRPTSTRRRYTSMLRPRVADEYPHGRVETGPLGKKTMLDRYSPDTPSGVVSTQRACQTYNTVTQSRSPLEAPTLQHNAETCNQST